MGGGGELGGSIGASVDESLDKELTPVAFHFEG